MTTLIISGIGAMIPGEHPSKSSFLTITVIDSRCASIESFGSIRDSNPGSFSGFDSSSGLKFDVGSGF